MGPSTGTRGHRWNVLSGDPHSPRQLPTMTLYHLPLSCAGSGLRQAGGWRVGWGNSSVAVGRWTASDMGPTAEMRRPCPEAMPGADSWGQAMGLLTPSPMLLWFQWGPSVLVGPVLQPAPAPGPWLLGQQQEHILEALVMAVACSLPCCFYHTRPPTKGHRKNIPTPSSVHCGSHSEGEASGVEASHEHQAMRSKLSRRDREIGLSGRDRRPQPAGTRQGGHQPLRSELSRGCRPRGLGGKATGSSPGRPARPRSNPPFRARPP